MLLSNSNCRSPYEIQYFVLDEEELVEELDCRSPYEILTGTRPAIHGAAQYCRSPYEIPVYDH